eukprot:1182412-Prorocentrum_minimum.AAC.1
MASVLKVNSTVTVSSPTSLRRLAGCGARDTLPGCGACADGESVPAVDGQDHRQVSHGGSAGRGDRVAIFHQHHHLALQIPRVRCPPPCPPLLPPPSGSIYNENLALQIP